MDDNQSRAKRAPRELWLYRNYTDNKYGPWAQERQILEVIALGAPLPGILNKLCSMIDAQIGNVVSVVSLADETESHFGPRSQTAMRVGLTEFSSTDIFSRSKTLLGTLEIYTCDSRQPTPDENRLIQRVVRLAAVALQRHKDAEELERSSRDPRSAVDGDEAEKPPFIN
jgi:hypothetical protein